MGSKRKVRKKRGVPLSQFPLIKSHELYLGAKEINWDEIKHPGKFLKTDYATIQPTRRIFGFLILEQVRKLKGDDLIQNWKEVPMMQYFTGETWFHFDSPITKEEIQVFKSNLTIEGKEHLNHMIGIVQKYNIHL